MPVVIDRKINNPYVTLFSYDVDSNLEFIGKAIIGSPTNTSVWQIKKLNYTNSNLDSIKWADSNDLFDNIWDDRVALIYG